MYCAQRQAQRERRGREKRQRKVGFQIASICSQLNLISAFDFFPPVPRELGLWRESLIYNGVAGARNENSPDLQDATAKSQKCNWKRKKEAIFPPPQDNEEEKDSFKFSPFPLRGFLAALNPACLPTCQTRIGERKKKNFRTHNSFLNFACFARDKITLDCYLIKLACSHFF